MIASSVVSLAVVQRRRQVLARSSRGDLSGNEQPHPAQRSRGPGHAGRAGAVTSLHPPTDNQASSRDRVVLPGGPGVAGKCLDFRPAEQAIESIEHPNLIGTWLTYGEPPTTSP